jgi:predicted ribosomally synthesized peptide with nif11-like leader
MSEEQLKAFLEAVEADEGLQEKLKAAGDADAVIAIAKAAGFAISADELKKAQSEISEEELEGVAGGVAGGTNYGICPFAALGMLLFPVTEPELLTP